MAVSVALGLAALLERQFRFQEHKLQFQAFHETLSCLTRPVGPLGGPSLFGREIKGFPQSPARIDRIARLDSPHPRTPCFRPVSLSFGQNSLFCLVNPR